MDNASRWLTNAQIAVSTGTSGNSSIPNYEHLALVSGGSDYFGNAGIAPRSRAATTSAGRNSGRRTSHSTWDSGTV